MADGKWVMTEEDARRVDLSYSGGMPDLRKLPNYGQTRMVDDRSGSIGDGTAGRRCAFCGSEDLQSGFGGCGKGFGYRSYKCRVCGGSTNFVYKDEVGKFF